MKSTLATLLKKELRYPLATESTPFAFFLTILERLLLLEAFSSTLSFCGPYWFPVNRTTNWTVITSTKPVSSKSEILSGTIALIAKYIWHLERERSFYSVRLR